MILGGSGLLQLKYLPSTLYCTFTFKSYINPSHGVHDPVVTIPSASISMRPGEAVLAMPGVYRFFVTGHRKT